MKKLGLFFKNNFDKYLIWGIVGLLVLTSLGIDFYKAYQQNTAVTFRMWLRLVLYSAIAVGSFYQYFARKSKS